MAGALWFKRLQFPKPKPENRLIEILPSIGRVFQSRRFFRIEFAALKVVFFS
jgi:hypothetical protein